MDNLFDVNWKEILTTDTPLLEIFIRGTIVYLSIFLLLRLVLKRQSGAVGITDLLVLVLIADAAQNAMAGDYTSIPDGLLLVSTIVFWSYALDWLGYRFPRIQRLIHPPPLPLIKDGKILHQNMRKELITKNELMTQLRQQGVKDICNVHLAFMEGDGNISVIKNDESSQESNKKKNQDRGV